MGTPLCIDAATNKNPFERHFAHYVRVLVDIDLTQELRYKVLVERKGYAFFDEMEYENLPEYCTFCNCTGHYFEICKRRNPTNQAENKQKNKNKPETRGEYVQIADNRGKGKQVEVFDLDKNSGEIPEAQVQTNEAGTSGEKEDINLSNRYMELARLEDEILEKEINDVQQVDADTRQVNVSNNGENSDSNESEFVDATQVHDTDNEIEDREEVNQQTNKIIADVQGLNNNTEVIPVAQENTNRVPTKVQKDMEFLHQSWANMAELEPTEGLAISDEDNENLLKPDLNEAHMDFGFQLVKSRRGKRRGRHMSAPRRHYNTRPKPGKTNLSL